MRELKAQRIKRQINELWAELDAHQERCSHIRLKKKFGGDSGNWDKSDDSYWVDVYCPTCEMKERIYDDDPRYKEYQ